MNCDHETHAVVPVPATAEAAWQENKRLLMAALLAAGACVATVSYVGLGDSGSVEGVTVEMGEGKTFDPFAPVGIFVEESDFVDGKWKTHVVRRDVPIEDALRDFAAESVDQHHSGYENGDGGSGEVIFTCDTQTVRIEHNDYYTDSEYTETEL